MRSQRLHVTLATCTRGISMETKLAKLKQMMADGDHRGALKLAASWPRLGDHKAAIERGWAALQNPATYEAMGYDSSILVRAGLDAIRERYELT